LVVDVRDEQNIALREPFSELPMPPYRGLDMLNTAAETHWIDLK
jgi:hypothetical protein